MVDKFTIGLRWNLPIPETALHCVHNVKHICHEQSKPQTERIKKEAWWDLYVIRDISGWRMLSKSHLKQQRRGKTTSVSLSRGDIFTILALKRSLLPAK